MDIQIQQNLNDGIENEHKTDIHSEGQYFTTDKYLQKTIFDLIKNKPKIILEPSVGRGDLVKSTLFYRNQTKQNTTELKFDMYEKDNTIDFLDTIDKKDIVFGDFLVTNINKTYKTIIGNPPFIKNKTGNIYIKFIEKCFGLLKNNGELIFIVPSDFIKLSSSSNVINKMLSVGTFTDIIHPNKENYFENASIDIIIFRYCKDTRLPNKINYNSKQKYLINTNGILTFSDKDIKQTKLDHFSVYFDIYVGMVTGKEEIFKNNEYGNLELLNGHNKIDKYILIHEYPTNNESLNKYLEENKVKLQARKIRKFNENNWYQWGALRNYKSITEIIEGCSNKKCIYVNTITRNKKVCFIDKVRYFGGGLIALIPKNDSNINLNKIEEYINSERFKSNYMYSGRFKIGHKQLSNCLFEYSKYRN